MFWRKFARRSPIPTIPLVRSGTDLENELLAKVQVQPRNLVVPSYYLDRHEDVRLAGVDPYRHFELHGLSEERDANPFFDVQFYKSHMMPMAPLEGISNAYEHYIKIGSFLDLWTGIAFDPVYYRNRHRHLSTEPIDDALTHFLRIGAKRGWFATTAEYADLEGE